MHYPPQRMPDLARDQAEEVPLEEGTVGGPVSEDRGCVCSVESTEGAMDLWSSMPSSTASANHLVVMVHGILGSMADWKFAADQFSRLLPDKVIVHCSKCNSHRLTLDGVDVMGDRLAEEVMGVIAFRPGIQKISFISHSVGGLVARYAIGKLYKCPVRNSFEELSDDDHNVNSKGTIAGLEAMNFITVATPHLGSRGNKQVPFLLGINAFERVATLVIHLIFKRTGKHLFLTDNDGGEAPLLRRMVNDCGDLSFMSALQAFRRRVVYANAGCDHGGHHL